MDHKLFKNVPIIFYIFDLGIIKIFKNKNP